IAKKAWHGRDVHSESVLLPGADIRSVIATCLESARAGLTQSSKLHFLLDHLVGLGEKVGRDGNADHSRRRQVEDQHELGRLDNRHIGWLLALEDAAGIDADLTVPLSIARSIAH